MTQLAAYALDRPKGVDLPGLERAAQFARDREYDLQTKPGKVALTNAQTAAGLDEESSLAAFRMKAKKGDPKAADELKGYPEKYKAAVKMFDGMDPEDWRDSQLRATAFGQAARTVMAFQDGSKEQRAAWDRALGELMAQGHIDKEQHDGMVAQGPDANIIKEAMELDDFVKTYAGTRADKARAQEGLTKARIDDIGIDNARADEKTGTDIANVGLDNDRADAQAKDRAERNKKLSAKTDADIANIEADNVRADKKEGGKAGGMSEAETGRRVRDVQTKLSKLRNDGGTEDEIAAEEKRLKREYGLTKAAGTADDPFTPATRAEAEALPPGSYFITPKGQLKQK